MRRYYGLPVVLSEFTGKTTLDWWFEKRLEFPILYRVAKRFLSIPGTSASVERVFSQGGLTLTELRSAMTAATFEALMVLKLQHEHGIEYYSPAEWAKLCEII